jgi:hypothetical protein
MVALASMAIDIATNRWLILRAETKTAALMIETAIFPTVLQFAVKF